jgi:hypothetical protein
VYAPLMSIVIEHPAYDGAPARDLSILPLPGTERLMHNAGLIMRRISDGVTLFFDSEKTDALEAYGRDLADPFTLVFRLVSENPFFENFTELPGDRQGRIVFLESGRKQEDGVFPLTKGEALASADLQDKEAENIQPLLAQAGTPLLGLVAVAPLQGMDLSGLPGHRTYRIRFRGRKSIWKYLLLGKFSDTAFSVVDLDGEVTFSRKADETLPDSRKAGVAESDTPLPLVGKGTFRFQLRRENGKSERVMVPRLPLAPLDRINMRTTPDQKTEFFSEIFINP